jgi:hypothetical protein
MWPFKQKTTLPGVERQPNGPISFTLTDEEQDEVSSFFRVLNDPNQQETGEMYIHPDAHKAMTALALIGYVKHQVILSETYTDRIDKDLCIRKALAAAMKAHSFHSVPIYMFDMGCIFEILGDTPSAQEAFRSFLELQRVFQPSDVDRIALRERDVGEAIKQAVERTDSTRLT